ncbi:MAG: type II toxin-antitoxin system VapC family toxin [Verrucomicrobia bacterium]|nr:type II toxin-antitoxin system VapC family toxin [Verrucomicrobiota bacterium]
MRKPILVDTDIMVDYLRGHGPAVSFVQEHADQIVLSSIEVAQLYSGVKGDREQAILDDLISVFRIVPVTAEIAKDAGLLKRDYGRSHGVRLADAVIAATARTEGAELKTLNVKHYPMFKGLLRAYSRK